MKKIMVVTLLNGHQLRYPVKDFEMVRNRLGEVVSVRWENHQNQKTKLRHLNYDQVAAIHEERADQ
jgi:hypothetical protein